MLDGLAQIRHSLGVITHADVVVGVGVIPILNGTEIHRVATHVTNHVLGIVSPAQHGVAFSQPRTGKSAAGRIAQVQACHIREGSGGLFKLSHLELCLTKHQPRFPQKRVLLAPFHLNGVALDGFLHLLNRSLVMRFAYVATQFVANGVKRQQFGKVILVAFLFFQISIQKGHVTIIIGVIAGVEGVPEPALGGVFVLRKAHGCHQRDNQHHAHISSIPSHYSLFTNHYSLFTNTLLFLLLKQAVYLARALVGSCAGRAVVTLLNHILALIKPVGYQGYQAQHQQHAYTY